MESLSQLSKNFHEIGMCKDPNCLCEIPLQLLNISRLNDYSINDFLNKFKKFKNMDKKAVPLSIIDYYSNTELSFITKYENCEGVTYIFDDNDGILDIYKCCYGAVKPFHLYMDGEIIMK